MVSLFDKIDDGHASFGDYDKAHPQVWQEFEKVALTLIKRGVKRYGAKAIFEIIRYRRIIDYERGWEFKLNNNYTADYARKFMQKYPRYKGFFETRKKVKR